MKQSIQAFVDQKKLAVAGVSPNKDNFGLYLMKELGKLGREIYPVNPLYDEIMGQGCVPSVKDLPADIENLILAVPPHLSESIVEQLVGTGIKRIWMVKGMGKGAYSEKAHAACDANQIEVVYGFCPMMFLGAGGHKFHLWLRKNFGKIPGEYALS